MSDNIEEREAAVQISLLLQELQGLQEKHQMLSKQLWWVKEEVDKMYVNRQKIKNMIIHANNLKNDRLQQQMVLNKELEVQRKEIYKLHLTHSCMLNAMEILKMKLNLQTNELGDLQLPDFSGGDKIDDLMNSLSILKKEKEEIQKEKQELMKTVEENEEEFKMLAKEVEQLQKRTIL